MLQVRQSLLGSPAYQVGLCPQGLQDARSLATCSMQGAWALGWPFLAWAAQDSSARQPSFPT